uniref:Protein rp20-signalp detected n=1 Tax=Lutzomyia longipalpis TaxID=7200 RepID=A0A1B0GKG2_LUTLO
MRIGLKFCSCVVVFICILGYVEPLLGKNEGVTAENLKHAERNYLSSLGWIEKAKGFFSGPTGTIISNVAKEMLGRSTGNSQVLSLNLTNLFILLFLKALIFSAGLIGTSHWGGGYYGRARSIKHSFLENEEVPLLLGYLASEGSGQKGCLYRAACLTPYRALEYSKAGHAVLKGTEIFNPDFNQEFHYNYILK